MVENNHSASDVPSPQSVEELLLPATPTPLNKNGVNAHESALRSDVTGLVARYYSDVTRYTTSSFLRMN
ncbi:hypothetical protein B0G80_2068 [Paraburkholderia sp. BL6669N2]|nr:hypothetical protein B0G80_2068 [Paraburkholderia sp. BL6669N2]